MFQITRTYFNGILLSFVFFTLSLNAYAYGESDLTEMSLVIQSNDISLRFPASVDKTKVSTLEINWWQEFSKSLEGRLSIAYVELTQSANSSVLAYDTSGYELGLGFRGDIFESEIVNLGFSLNLDYMASAGETSTKLQAEVSWYKYSGSVDFVFLPSKPISILTGASYTAIDGEHKIIDVTSSSVTFTEDTPVGYYAGLSFKSGGRGKVNVIWQGGHRQGIYLVFSNRF